MHKQNLFFIIKYMSEIEIPLEDINKESGKETIEQPEQPEQQEPKQEIVKDISKLTLEERAKIISDARNGIPSEHYDVIVLKNGNTRIVKKKIKTPSLSTRLIDQAQNKEQNNEENNVQEKSKKIYMSDNQLMMEHIIELNNQVNKLMNKQKKLKKKYRSLKHDIYEEELEQEVNKQDVKPEIKPEVKQETKPETNNQVNNQVQYKRKGWRSYVSYL